MKNIYLLIFSFFLFATANSQVLDSSYGVNGKLIAGQFDDYMYINGAYLDPLGRIITGASSADEEAFNTGTSISAFTISGTVDSTFGYGGSISSLANTLQGGFLTHQSNNKIIAAGVASYDPFDVYRVVTVERFNMNGSRDSSFGTNGVSVIDRGYGPRQLVYCTTVDAQDNIYIGGAIYKIANGPNHITVVRFKPNGHLDTSFYILNKTNYEDKCYSLNVLADGSVIAGYLYNNYTSACLVKYKPDGSRDASFGINGIVSFHTNCSSGNFFYSIILNDGSILSATGNSDKISFYKILSSGLPDNSFGNHGIAQTNDLINGFSTYSHYFSVDAYNRILLPLGSFKIKRLLPNGKTDLSFGTNGYVATDFRDSLPGAFEVALVQGNSFFGVGRYTDFTSSHYAIAKYKNTPNTLQHLISKAGQNNINSNKFVGNVKIYPNPVGEILHVTGLNNQSNIKIVDAKGNLIKACSGQSALDVHGLLPGMYYLIVNNGLQTMKFIKE